MNPQLLSDVFLIDALLDLCLNLHPVLLVEHGHPPGNLAIAEG
jgi:hypothetical protein